MKRTILVGSATVPRVRAVVIGLATACAVSLAGCAVSGVPGRASGSATTSVSAPVSARTTTGTLTGTIVWNTGSMPPPANYSWTVTFDGTSGSIVLTTKYAARNQDWQAQFAVTAESLSALTAALYASGVGRETANSGTQMVGGSTGQYRLVDSATSKVLAASLGDSTATSSELATIADAVQTFVGPSAWNSVNDGYHQWQTTYTR